MNQDIFCVISIATCGENECHNIQTNSAWTANPYGDEYAVVPSYMIEEIMETRGFCDIVLSRDKKTVVSFTPREIPEPEPMPEPEPRAEDMLNALVGGMSYE